jgi:hypothetical protein
VIADRNATTAEDSQLSFIVDVNKRDGGSHAA